MTGKLMMVFAIASVVLAQSSCENGRCNIKVPEDEVSLIQATMVHRLGEEVEGELRQHSMMAPGGAHIAENEAKKEKRLAAREERERKYQQQEEECVKQGLELIDGECKAKKVQKKDCSKRSIQTPDGWESQCFVDKGSCFASNCSPNMIKALKMASKCNSEGAKNFWMEFGSQFSGKVGSDLLDALGVKNYVSGKKTNGERAYGSSCPTVNERACGSISIVGCCDGGSFKGCV